MRLTSHWNKLVRGRGASHDVLKWISFQIDIPCLYTQNGNNGVNICSLYYAEVRLIDRMIFIALTSVNLYWRV